MLNSVKSVYITKIIISNLEEKQKFKITKYNKRFQNKLNIDITDYKRCSGKYLIYENGIGKEYNVYNDKLLFEGEYKNGKGKEYNIYNDKILFEGEYLNRLKSGKAKEYYDNGKIKFEGEIF